MSGVDDDDDAARVVGHAIGNVREQKLLRPAIPTFPDHDGVDLLFVDHAQNGLRGIGIDNGLGSALCPCNFLRQKAGDHFRGGRFGLSGVFAVGHARGTTTCRTISSAEYRLASAAAQRTA
jgi:hypothetical protein